MRDVWRTWDPGPSLELLASQMWCPLVYLHGTVNNWEQSAFVHVTNRVASVWCIFGFILVLLNLRDMRWCGRNTVAGIFSDNLRYIYSTNESKIYKCQRLDLSRTSTKKHLAMTKYEKHHEGQSTAHQNRSFQEGSTETSDVRQLDRKLHFLQSRIRQPAICPLSTVPVPI